MTAVKHCLVSFLGTGSYDECRYAWESDIAKPVETRFICRALAELDRADRVRILATDEAWKAHGECLTRELGQVPVERVLIPHGKTPEERWALFEIIKKELRPGKGWRLTLDITHGFRSQPFFSGAVVGFVRSIDEEPVDLKVVYGAWEHRGQNDGVAPIWDLSEFNDVVDWSAAIRLFLRAGVVTEVAESTERLGREMGRSWAQNGRHGQPPTLQALGQAMAQFGEHLSMLRTGDLLFGDDKGGSAGRLARTVEMAKLEVLEQLPPLADVFQRLEEMMSPFVVKPPVPLLNTLAGRDRLLELARVYERFGRPLEAEALLREGWVSLHADDDGARPGGQGCTGSRRREAEERWHRAHSKEARNLTGLRNDLLHAGFRHNPGRAESIRAGLAKAARAFELQDPAPPAPEEDEVGGLLVNISNHPSDSWPAAQKQAAGRLAARVEDVAFPQVRPEASEEEVARVAHETLATKLPLGTTAAMVMGELTLCAWLVRELQARGIRCYVATTPRAVAEEGDLKISRYTFARFREYPPLGGQEER